MSKQTSTKDLSEIIVRAIEDEPYFTKDVLVPKIKAIISGFRLDIASINYAKAPKDGDLARLRRSVEMHNHEKVFWSENFKKLVGKENMQQYYDLLNIEREKWSAKEGL
jgi:hypothetical protein